MSCPPSSSDETPPSRRQRIIRKVRSVARLRGTGKPSTSKPTSQPTSSATGTSQPATAALEAAPPGIPQISIDLVEGEQTSSKDSPTSTDDATQSGINILVCGNSSQAQVQWLQFSDEHPVVELNGVLPLVNGLDPSRYDVTNPIAFRVVRIQASDAKMVERLSKMSKADNLVGFFRSLKNNPIQIFGTTDLKPHLHRKNDNLDILLLPAATATLKVGSTITPPPGIRPGIISDGRASQNSDFHVVRRYTQAFEDLSTAAVHSLLPNCLGIGFTLRHAQFASRTLERVDIRAEVTRRLCKGTDEASAEIDCFGYVDYFNESRINNDNEKRVKCMGQKTLDVSLPETLLTGIGGTKIFGQTCFGKW
jgi:hypothetical protein